MREAHHRCAGTRYARLMPDECWIRTPPGKWDADGSWMDVPVERTTHGADARRRHSAPGAAPARRVRSLAVPAGPDGHDYMAAGFWRMALTRPRASGETPRAGSSRGSAAPWAWPLHRRRARPAAAGKGARHLAPPSQPSCEPRGAEERSARTHGQLYCYLSRRPALLDFASNIHIARHDDASTRADA